MVVIITKPEKGKIIRNEVEHLGISSRQPMWLCPLQMSCPLSLSCSPGDRHGRDRMVVGRPQKL